MSCFCAFCSTQKKNNNKDIGFLWVLRKKKHKKTPVFFSFLFVTHLMPESSRKREEMKIFKRTGCLTTKVIFHPTYTDMHVQERRHCLSHWIIIWRFGLSRKALYCSQHVLHKIVLGNWINRTVSSDKMAPWEVLPGRDENTGP